MNHHVREILWLRTRGVVFLTGLGARSAWVGNLKSSRPCGYPSHSLILIVVLSSCLRVASPRNRFHFSSRLKKPDPRFLFLSPRRCRLRRQIAYIRSALSCDTVYSKEEQWIKIPRSFSLELMIMYEQDPDVIRWGLHLLQGDPASNSEYCGTANQNDVSVYNGNYTRENDFRDDGTTVENDEIIAQALQEEFSQVAVVEASGPSHAGEEKLQASVLSQDWFGPTISNFISVPPPERAEDMESSCSSPGEKLYDGVEYSIELTDDFSTLDGEVGKRLNQMVPVRHVPRINGEIPSADEATTDHQRLLDRLKLYDLVELKVQGDGNCQFRALSDQFYRSTEHHKFVRQQVVNQLKSHPEIYDGYVPMAYDEYLKKMSKNGEWGDHVTLQAAADSYGVRIFILTSFKDTCYTEILPNVQKSKRVIFLSFWAEVHYNSIYPEGELPTSESKKKKRGILLEQLPCSLM